MHEETEKKISDRRKIHEERQGENKTGGRNSSFLCLFVFPHHFCEHCL